MNERYGPVAIRFLAILVVLAVGGFLLMRYVAGRADSALGAERARADMLGWEQVPKETIPPYEADLQNALSNAYRSLPTQAHAQLRHHDMLVMPLTPGLRSSYIASTNEAVQILSEITPTLEEAVKHPLPGKMHRFAERRILCKALLGRALALSAEGKPDQAFGSLRLAALIAGIFAPEQTIQSIGDGPDLRAAWVRLSARNPEYAKSGFEFAPALHEYAKGYFLRLVRLSYGNNRGESVDGMNHNQKRNRFNRLQTGNDLTERMNASFADPGKAVAFLAEVAKKGELPKNEEVKLLSELLTINAVGEQLCKLYKEALAGGNPPSLAASTDALNDMKPLKFKARADGFNLYSVGLDKIDSGGNFGDLGIKYTKGTARSDFEGIGTWK